MKTKRKGWFSPFMSSSRGSTWNNHIKAAVRLKPLLRKTMTACNEFWSESAEWHRIDGLWRCVGATGVLAQLKGMSPAQAKIELLRLGASWRWS